MSLEKLNKCILCGASGEGFCKPYSVQNGYAIVQCKSCQLIFVNPRDNQETVLKQYCEDETSPISYYQSTSDVNTVNFNKRLDWIERHMSIGKLLDVGCSVGTFIETAKKRGWSVLGIEANRKACEVCKNKNLNVVNGLFESEFVKSLPQKDFDLVCLNDSIEHFSNPLDALILTKSLLRENGYCSISTPNIENILAKIFQMKPKEHLFYFNEATLSKILSQSGFKIEMIVETGRRRPVGKMHLGASINQKWYYVSRFLSASGLHSLASIFLEQFFKDELFVLARKS